MEAISSAMEAAIRQKEVSKLELGQLQLQSVVNAENHREQERELAAQLQALEEALHGERVNCASHKWWAIF